VRNAPFNPIVRNWNSEWNGWPGRSHRAMEYTRVDVDTMAPSVSITAVSRSTTSTMPNGAGQPPIA
jgi:hypothetical protein